MDSKELAWKIRKHAIDMTNNAGSSHIGAALSIADIVAVLYATILNYNPENPQGDNRDRFVLSKGHAGAAVYAVLAETGYFEISELDNYCKNGSNLSGHVSHKNVRGVEFSTGSLGHGACVAAGIAMALKLNQNNNHVYAIIGDGECNEGSIWEMALFACQYELSNLTVIVDSNGMQGLGQCDKVLNIEPLEDKWKDFGFNVIQVDGHDHAQLNEAFKTVFSNNKPKCIIATTVKGKGISFMENNLLWHYRPPQGDEYEAAIKELEAAKQ